MTSIRNLATLVAAIPTMVPKVGLPPTQNAPRGCGEVNVFYTGLPPYHPMVIGQGWDPLRVDIGLKNETVNLVKAGYNVQIVWAGPETPISVIEDRISKAGVNFDVAAIGFGVRGSTQEVIVERFEDLVDMFYHTLPDAPKVYNHSPESLVWSVAHRAPLSEDCVAANKPGKLIGYEEICDSRCSEQKTCYEERTKPTGKLTRDEL